jgi:hypothetical protein
VLQERADGGQPAPDGGGREAAIAQRDGVLVEHADRDRVGVLVLDEVAEIDQVAAVCLDGVRRRSPLQLEVGQEIRELSVVVAHRARGFRHAASEFL